MRGRGGSWGSWAAGQRAGCFRVGWQEGRQMDDQFFSLWGQADTPAVQVRRSEGRGAERGGVCGGGGR